MRQSKGKVKGLPAKVLLPRIFFQIKVECKSDAVENNPLVQNQQYGNVPHSRRKKQKGEIRAIHEESLERLLSV